LLFSIKFVISLSGSHFGYFPRAPEIWLCHRTHTKHPWQTCIRNVNTEDNLNKGIETVFS